MAAGVARQLLRASALSSLSFFPKKKRAVNASTPQQSFAGVPKGFDWNDPEARKNKKIDLDAALDHLLPFDRVGAEVEVEQVCCFPLHCFFYFT